jgi:hypothetical protein
MNVTFAFPSIVKTGPNSHVMIILKPNVPTLSNVIALWSEPGQPPAIPDQSANCVKIPLGGVALKTFSRSMTKRSPGVNPAAADCAGARAMYFSTKGLLPGSVPNNEPFPLQSTILIWLSKYWLTYR